MLGSANAEATGIETDRLAVTISGAGHVRMGGKADEQEIDISGTGIYRQRTWRAGRSGSMSRE